MNNKAVTLSLVFGLFGFFMVQSYVESIENEAKRKFGTEVFVVTAKEDIKELQTINETMLELRPVPKQFLEPAAISFADNSGSVAKEMKGLTGTIAVVPVKKGEQITYNKVTEPNIRTGLAPQISPGKRAISVPVNETTGISKLVKPGDRVDVLATIQLGGNKTNTVVKTVLQDVIVLSVGRNISNNVPRVIERRPGATRSRTRVLTTFDGFSSVSLEVTPKEAAMLTMVMNNTSSQVAVNLVLRNNDDTERTDVPSVGIVDVLGKDAQKIKLPGNRAGGGGRFRRR